MGETTIRIPANKQCPCDCYDLQANDTYQFGCEFEFNLNIHTLKDIPALVEKIQNEIFLFSNVDILVDQVNLINDPDRNQCVQIKPDYSLENNGIEITTPMTSVLGIKHYIKNIFDIIDRYGYTDESTGLHFHISTIKVDGTNFNFYTYMLICHDKELLSSWPSRLGYSENVMDVLGKHSKSEARKIKDSSKCWNLQKISANHIEIRAMGGKDYHKQLEKVLSEFELYADAFDNVFTRKEPEYILKLIEEHKKHIAEIQEINNISLFVAAVQEAGLLDDNSKLGV